MQENEFVSDDFLDQFLKADPGYSLPDDFAEKVAARAKKRMEVLQTIRDFLIYIGTFLVVSTALFGFAYFRQLELLTKLKSLGPTNLAWLAGIVVIGVFVLFIDKVILPCSFLFRTLRK